MRPADSEARHRREGEILVSHGSVLPLLLMA